MESALHQQWKTLEQKALAGGGAERQDKQHATGKLTARERIELLIDPESFTEFDRLAQSSLTASELTDGVITGFCTINGRNVALYAQDFTIKGGSLGKRHAEKICKIMDMAANIGCPIVGIIDSGGARIEEGIHALAGYAGIFRRNSHYSGVLPQISIIVGPCAGGAVYSPALTDFVFMTENISQMFITGPQVIQEVLHETVTKEELGGWKAHATASGVAHVVSPDEQTCFARVRQLLSYLPSTYLDQAPTSEHSYSIDQKQLEALLPTNPNNAYNCKDIITTIFDAGSFFEIQPLFASNIIIGFARIDGQTVGVVANQPTAKAGCIDIDASCKAARFIQCCDSFNIPIITLVDTPGYLPGVAQEHDGIIRHGAKLLHAYAQATVPKITIIMRKAFGGAYIVMGSKELGADINLAWPSAQIAVLGAKAGVTILHGKKLAGMEPGDRSLTQDALEADYSKNFLHPFIAAAHGYIDNIIEPSQTRLHISKGLRLLREKVEKRPARKHSNQPL
jgi:methylmalonyl-CoA decarboxylase subunit alpha